MTNLKPIERVFCILSGAILGALLMTAVFAVCLEHQAPNTQRQTIDSLKSENTDLRNQLQFCEDK